MTALELVERLRRKTRFGDLLGRVELVISPLIVAYRRALPRPATRLAVKAIKDAVWGMIDVTAQELVVLDSPPLQRLRRIRQLGLTHLTRLLGTLGLNIRLGQCIKQNGCCGQFRPGRPTRK
jgi:hypothetical protein